MPRYICSVCYEEFKLPRREHKLLLGEMEKFCTVSCVEAFIFGLEKGDAYKVKKSSTQLVFEESIYDCISEGHYRSWYEVYVARFFVTNAIVAEYESRAFQTTRGKYIPDFFLPEYALFVEVKGLWSMSAKAKFKNVAGTIEELGYRIILLPSYLNKEFRIIYKLHFDNRSVVR